METYYCYHIILASSSRLGATVNPGVCWRDFYKDLTGLAGEIVSIDIGTVSAKSHKDAIAAIHSGFLTQRFTISHEAFIPPAPKNALREIPADDDANS